MGGAKLSVGGRALGNVYNLKLSEKNCESKVGKQLYCHLAHRYFLLFYLFLLKFCYVKKPKYVVPIR